MTIEVRGRSLRVGVPKAVAAGGQFKMKVPAAFLQAERDRLLEASMGSAAARTYLKNTLLEKRRLTADTRAALHTEAINASARAPVQFARRMRLPDTAKQRMCQWFDAHRDNPFPTDAQKV